MANNEENLERLKSASTIARLAEEDLKDAVTRALLDGASWAEIGETLGISKQTAHNRYRKEVEFHERCDSGEYVARGSMPAADAERFMSSVYNPESRVSINMKRDWNYRRTRRDDAPGQ